MDAAWTRLDHAIIIGIIRDDLTDDQQLEIASFDDETFVRFVRRLFIAVQADFDEARGATRSRWKAS